MRKFLLSFVVLTLVITSVFCFACKAEDAAVQPDSIQPVAVAVPFQSGQTVMAAMDAFAEGNVDFHFSHYLNATYNSETLTLIQKGEVEVKDNYDTNTYISYYINKKDATLIDAAVDPIYYNGEAYYLTLATVEKLTAEATLKIAFVTVTWNGDFTSSAVNATPAILVSFTNA